MIKYALLNVERGAFQLARIPERSKGTDLRSVALASWVRIPLRASTGMESRPGKDLLRTIGMRNCRTDAVRVIVII